MNTNEVLAEETHPVIVEDQEPDIPEIVRIECPKCHAEIIADAADRNDIACFCCGRRIRVKSVPAAGEPVIEETLGLPRGSVRAMVALILSASCWIVIFKGYKVPPRLFSLILTVIGYYFAFRHNDKYADIENAPARGKRENAATEKGVDDAFFQVDSPLYLPSGWVRRILVAGFLLAALEAYNRHFMEDCSFRNFFIVIAGLAAGYFFAKTMDGNLRRDANFYNFITHCKGVLVISATLGICGMFLSGKPVEPEMTICSCIITFYFGSKT